MGRKGRKYEYIRKDYRRTPVTKNICDKCKGYGWTWFIEKGENMKTATMQYRDACTKCKSSGEYK